MFCIHCGKSNVENASFCAYCGGKISQTGSEDVAEPARSKTIEWDYDFYDIQWETRNGGRWNLTFGRTEYDVRQDIWAKDQDSIMPDLQEYIENGWKYVNKPGPNSYRFEHHKEYIGNGVEITWLSVSSFIVDFRRPAKPLKEKEKQIVGKWQEVNNPNDGVLKTFGNLVFSHKLSVNKYVYEFYKDHTFKRIDREEKEISGGVFYENEKSEIEIFYKYSPYLNSVVSLSGNKLTFSKDHRHREFERAS